MPLAGSPDKQTIDSSGRTTAADVDGVAISAPVVHEDHRGVLVEILSDPRFWDQPFTYAYQTSIRPGFYKGWFVHRQKTDRYHLVTGELLTFLFDDRVDSPTKGLTQKVMLSERTNRDILIPPGVWHLTLNVGSSEAIIVNLPTTAYNRSHPDREFLPADTPEIPLDVRAFFPPTGFLPVPPNPRGE
ncbi:dTDP-4-dehydrorhamnose 3,5-epimerase family protein [Pontimonas sp.]|nr:dTDP-4-dehydrorhamnose 3,5-epimerase family protein [Pontimonas sp.]